jgi:hypothetical protein
MGEGLHWIDSKCRDHAMLLLNSPQSMLRKQTSTSAAQEGGIWVDSGACSSAPALIGRGSHIAACGQPLLSSTAKYRPPAMRMTCGEFLMSVHPLMR